MFAQLRKFAALLVLAAVSRPVYALPQVTVSGNVYITNLAGQTVSTSPLPASQPAATPAASTPAATTPVAATTSQPPAASATVYTYTTIINGVTYTNIDTYTPTFEPTVTPTLTLKGSIMPYAQFTSLYFQTKSSATSAYSVPAGVLWMGVTTLLGFILGVRAVGLL